MAQWLRADTLVYTDAGLTPAADGQTVQEWQDGSGSGRPCTQAAPADRPVFTQASAAFNYRSVIYSSWKRLVCAQAVTARTMFVVSSSASATFSGYDGVMGNTGNTASTPRAAFYGLPGTKQYQIDGTLATVIYVNGITNGTQASPVVSDLTAPAVVSAVTTVPWSTDNIMIGQADTGQNRWSGSIAEVLIYSTALSDSDRKQVECYLAARYGIGLSGCM